MSRTTRLALSLVFAGLLIAAIGVITNPGYEAEAGAQSTTNSVEDALQPVGGLAPIDRVVAFWQERADAGPSDYLSRTQLGFAMLEEARETADLDRYHDAEQVFANAISLNPRHSPAMLGLAQSMHSQHRFAEALATAEQVVAATDSAVAELLVADALWELGQHAEAADRYGELLRIERSAPLLSRAAKVADLQGDSPLAVALANEALELAEAAPQRPHLEAFYQFQLGHFTNELGLADDARIHLETARQIAPTHAGATELLAAIEHDAGNLELAASLYVELLERGPAADLHGTYAEIQRSLGNVELAELHERLGLDLALETMESQPAERRHTAGFFLERDPAIALDLALQDLQERQDVGAWELLAEAQRANGNIEAAEAAEAAAAELVADLRAR